MVLTLIGVSVAILMVASFASLGRVIWKERYGSDD